MRVTCGQPWPKVMTLPCLNSESTSRCRERPSAESATSRCATQPLQLPLFVRAARAAPQARVASDQARGSYCPRPQGLPERNSFSSACRGARSLSSGEPVCAEFPGHGPLDNALAGNSNCQCVPATRDANISAAYTMTRENFTPMNLPPRASSSGCPRALDRVATPARLVVCPASGPSRRSLAR